MTYREKPSLSQEEALKLHHEALVIDSQIPTITIGGLYTDNLRKKMEESETESNNFLSEEFKNFANDEKIPSFGKKMPK